MNYFFARLGSVRLFWRVRYGLGWLKFKWLTAGFFGRNKLGDTAINAQYWRALSKGTVIPVLLAVLASALLYIFERNTSFFATLPWVRDNFIGDYLLHALDGDAYVQLLTVVAGVTGVFLGLYFAAVSTVISNAYSSVSTDVRELMLRDRLGSKYVMLVAFLTALSVVLLAFSAVGTSPLHLAIPVVAAVSCMAVFAFVNLGLRTFFLSDPTLFFNTLSSEILKWVKRATPKGYQWQNPSFQEHYRKQAFRAATTLETLAKISGEKPELQGRSHPRLLRGLLALVTVYSEDKYRIPSTSSWYGKKLQHKQWYLTESTELEMATQTNSGLKPNEVPNTIWLEDVVLGVVFDAFEADLKADDYQSFYNKTAELPDFFSGLGQQWQGNEAQKWHKKLSEDILERIVNGDAVDENGERYSIAAMSTVASLPFAIEIGLVKIVRELDLSKLRSQLARTKWYRANSPYRLLLPRNVVQSLEQVRDGLIFENQVKAPYKTKNWYITELVFHGLETALYEQWRSLMEVFETWYGETGKVLTKAKKYKHATVIYSAAIEQAWKLDSHIEQLKELAEELREGAKTDFIQRPKWGWDKEHDKVQKFRDAAIKGQAGLIPHLWDVRKPDPDMPDFFGGAVHRTGEACYEALASEDAEKFKTLFRPYFLGILGIFESIRSNPDVQGWEMSSAITWMSEPIVDLFDISGYAYIYSELHNNPEIWSECKDVWDTYLTNVSQQLQSFAIVSKHHQTPRGVITPRDTLRSRWQIGLARELGNLPRQQTTGFFSSPPVDHPSELIRNIAPSTDLPSMHTDAIDVFTVKYLLEREDAASVDFGLSQYKVDDINRQQGDDNA